MGRVYNALMKADRLPRRERPIGRRASDNAATPVNQRARRHDATEQRAGSFPAREASTTHENAGAIFSFSYDSAAKAPLLQSDGSSSLTVTSAAPQTAEPFNAEPNARSFIAQPFSASGALPRTTLKPAAFSPAPPPPAPVFEEPREIATVKSLAIDPHLVALTAQDVVARERYRTLAIRIINAASRRKLKTLVVTSAEQGEGKSTVAINLAWVMAKRAERRVLLIDASLRSPSISRMLGLASPRGWLNLSCDLSGLTEATVRLDPNGLYVMSQGTPATELERQLATDEMGISLISSRFEKFLAELQQRFDFIVIDAPTISGSAEAQQLASIADGTVIVARSGITHRRRVSAALALVPKDRRIGIVLNESETSDEATPRKVAGSLVDRLFGRKK